MTFDNDIAMPSAVKLNKRQKKGRFVLKDGKGYAYIHKNLFEADEVITDGKENLDLKGQFPKYENMDETYELKLMVFYDDNWKKRFGVMSEER